VRLEDGSQQGPGTSANIDDRVYAGPVLGPGDPLVFVATQVCQRAIEHFVLVREPAHAISEGLGVYVLEARRARLCAVAEFSCGLQDVLTTPEECRVSEPGPLGQFRRRERTGVEVIRHAALDERPAQRQAWRP